MAYKLTHTFETRSEESVRIMKKYPDRIPVIVEAGKGIQIMDKCKFLVPKDLSCSQFMHVLRKKISIKDSEAVFIFVDNTMPRDSSTMMEIYQQHKEACGFLFMVISREETFG